MLGGGFSKFQCETNVIQQYDGPERAHAIKEYIRGIH